MSGKSLRDVPDSCIGLTSMLLLIRRLSAHRNRDAHEAYRMSHFSHTGRHKDPNYWAPHPQHALHGYRSGRNLRFHSGNVFLLARLSRKHMDSTIVTFTAISIMVQWPMPRLD